MQGLLYQICHNQVQKDYQAPLKPLRLQEKQGQRPRQNAANAMKSVTK
jgi:hypothetical protein